METQFTDAEPVASTNESKLIVRLLEEKDISSADHVMRMAFGTFLGMPDPLQFMGAAEYVGTRWRSSPDSFFCAIVDDQLAGSNFVTNWGSVGFFGPLTVHPKFWDKGIAKILMEPVINCFEKWETRNAGLFTFATSQKHLGLYQKFGFRPRFLTALMSKQIQQTAIGVNAKKLSEFNTGEQENLLEECRQLTDSVYNGLDVSIEIRSVMNQNLGETILLFDDSVLYGLAVCHCGPGTEAGKDTCYIKFAVVRSDKKSAKNFIGLIAACEMLATEKHLPKLTAGVNTAREEAYFLMLNNGFRTDRLGVAMQRPNKEGYNRKGVYLIDDWR